MKKSKIICLIAFLLIVMGFIFFYNSFTTTDAENMYLSIYDGTDNGWQITEIKDGNEVSITSSQAVKSRRTVILRRTVPESWAQFDTVRVDSCRAVMVFVNDSFVFSNNSFVMAAPGELPQMKAPKNQPYNYVFSTNPSWEGKTITVVSKLYEFNESSLIDFALKSESISNRQHEAWVNKNTIPGAIFGMLSLLLFGLFLFQISTVKKGYPILLLAFASLLQMICYTSVLSETPLPALDITFATALYFLFPVLYVGTKIMKSKKAYFITAVLIWGIYFTVYALTFVFKMQVPIWFDKAELLCAVLAAVMLFFCFKEQKTNVFVRHFLKILAMFGIGYAVLFAVTAFTNPFIHNGIIILFKEASSLYLRPLLFWIYTTFLISLFILAVWELLQDRINYTKQMERLQNEQEMINLQMTATNEQLAALRASQNQTVIYRHDMRHTLALLYGFTLDKDIKKIKDYLEAAKNDIDSFTPEKFCENETVNLILSSFNAKAEKKGVKLNLEADLPPALSVNDTELCSLVSNAVENAINAAAPLKSKELRTVDIKAVIKNDKLLISTKNVYEGTVKIVDELPVSQNNEPGHGYGFKSMVNIIKKHNGMYGIETNGGVFVLRIIIPL